MDTVFSTQFAHLHQQAQRQVGQLSAVCEMLDLTAAESGPDTDQFLARLFEIMIRHLGTDSLHFKAEKKKEDENQTLPARLHVYAAGIPPLIPEEIQHVDSLINNESRCPAPERVYQQGNQATVIIPLETGEYRAGFLAVRHHDGSIFTPDQFRFMKLLANELTNILRLLENQQQLLRETRNRERLSRFFSPEISREIIANTSHQQRGKKIQATILFADIRGFSQLAEIHPPERIVDILNLFYQTMTRIIFKHRGTLDKFAGDGLLALFGTPVGREDDPCRAVQAAIEMQKEWQKHSGSNLNPAFAVGIHTGNVISGFLGNAELLTFTVIGDAVNTCHRIVSLAKAAEIIISSDTKAALDQHIGKKRVPSTAIVPYRSSQPLRGMEKVIDLYQVKI